MWFSSGRFPKDAAVDWVPAVAVEEAGKEIMAMMPITITPRGDAAAGHDPKPRDNKGVAALTDPHTFQNHDGVQHHDDQAAQR